MNTYRVETMAMGREKSAVVDADKFDVSEEFVRFFKDGVTVAAYATATVQNIILQPTPVNPVKTKHEQCYFTRWSLDHKYVPDNDCIRVEKHMGDHITKDGRVYSRLSGELIPGRNTNNAVD